MPFIVFFVLGAIFASEYHFLIKLLLIGICNVYMNTVMTHFYDDRVTKVLPMLIYLATKFWFYVTWIMDVSPHFSLEISLLFFFLSGFLNYFFVKSWLGDPGIIRTSVTEKLYTIIEIAERGSGFDNKTFCRTCLIKRPIRSKHCSMCDHCVAKFGKILYENSSLKEEVSPHFL